MTVRIAYLGTPAIAVPPLEALVAERDVTVAAVVTNPDRPRGRSGQPIPPPVKEAALRHDLHVLQPERPSQIVDVLAGLELDAAAVVAYGALLKPDVLATAGRGFVNLHYSLLPRWRGAAPVQHAILAGDRATGVTTFVLDEGMDTGPIIEQVRVEIGPNETSGSLLERLTAVGTPMLVSSVVALARGEVEPKPQAPEGATMAPKITSDDVRIDWTQPADRLIDLVRAANPAPGAHTTFRGDRFKIWLCQPADQADLGGTPVPDATAGAIVMADADGVVLACGEGLLRLREVQPAGKPRMDAGAFANGYQPDIGEVLGG